MDDPTQSPNNGPWIIGYGILILSRELGNKHPLHH